LQAEWPSPRLAPAIAAAAGERATQQERRVEQRLHELYGYDLVRRNCVTEIFRTIDDVEGVEAELGHRVVGTDNANFIPFVSAEAVRESYPVIAHFVLPSYHQQQLGQMRGASLGWRAMLREETSLSSTVVPFDVDYEAFLFFSSERFILRPLLGAANVAFGSGAMLAGAFAAPFDRGSLFTAGARGIFYSLPELAFVNIRKGTVPVLPSNWETMSR
jgi:hypothetical protein